MYAYLGAVWGYRHFWMALVKMDLRTRYRGSVLGIGWSLLQPMAMTAILCTVFTKLFNMDLYFYAPFLMVGLTFWNYVQGVVLLGSQCFFQGEMYIRQYPAPMAIYPLRTALGNGFHFLLALALAMGLACGTRGIPGPLALLSLVPTLLLVLIFGWSVATLIGLATVRFRDTNYLSELALQGLFYLTPVMYRPEMLIDRGMGMLVHYNPLMPFLNLLRQPILYGNVPALRTYFAACLVVMTVSSVSWVLLRREERRLIFLL